MGLMGWSLGNEHRIVHHTILTCISIKVKYLHKLEYNDTHDKNRSPVKETGFSMGNGVLVSRRGGLSIHLFLRKKKFLGLPVGGVIQSKIVLRKFLLGIVWDTASAKAGDEIHEASAGKYQGNSDKCVVRFHLAKKG